MSGYQPHFDIDFQRGLVGEKLVGTFLEALSGSKIEVKTDYRAIETGNVYVEAWQLNSKSQWVKSGLNVTEAEWFVFAGPSGDGFVAIKSSRLKELAMDAPRASIDISSRNTRATRGRLVTVQSIFETIFRKGN